MKNLRNKVQIIGFLGADVELKKVGKEDSSMARMSLATSSTYKDKNGESQTDTQWHNVVIWGKLADLTSEYTTKGSEVAIEGKLINRSYENKEGTLSYVTEVVAHEVLFLKGTSNN